MNTHFYDHIAGENIIDIMRSIEFFIGIIVVASAVGFVCLAVV